MKTKDIKTIDILTKTWFDRVNGNTYFAQRITINYGMDNEFEFINPFQYGYSSFVNFAFQKISKHFEDFNFNSSHELRQSGIVLRHNEHNNCKKRELRDI